MMRGKTLKIAKNCTINHLKLKKIDKLTKFKKLPKKCNFPKICQKSRSQFSGITAPNSHTTVYRQVFDKA